MPGEGVPVTPGVASSSARIGRGKPLPLRPNAENYPEWRCRWVALDKQRRARKHGQQFFKRGDHLRQAKFVADSANELEADG